MLRISKRREGAGRGRRGLDRRAVGALLGGAALLGLSVARAGAGLPAAITAGEVCFLPPELDTLLDASWDPIALAHVEEQRAWKEASDAAVSAAFAAALQGGAPAQPASKAESVPGPAPTPERGWALVLDRYGDEWCGIAHEVWLDGQLPDCEPVEVQASADRLQIAPGSGICPDRASGVDLRRVSGDRFRGTVCGETHELVLSATFAQRYEAWSARAADAVLKAAVAAGAPGLSLGPAVTLNGQSVRCGAAARDCDAQRLVAWCTDATDQGEMNGSHWLVGPRADGAGYEVLRADGGGRCMYHGVPGVSAAR